MPVTVDSGEHIHGAPAHAAAPGRSQFLASALGSIGVVYGDIGTSPLYAMREALIHSQEGGITREEVLGVTSLLLWALLFIVTAKYVLFLMRADNDGEGGTLSLMALAQRALGRPTTAVFVLGVAGAALFYGDALITPAISVLSAVEGLKLVTPVLDPLCDPDHGRHPVHAVRGTAAWHRQGGGPVRADHLALVRRHWRARCGSISEAISACSRPSARLMPWLSCLARNRSALPSWAACFSRSRVRRRCMPTWVISAAARSRPLGSSWSFPALALNYLGQAALILKNPDAIANPFFLMAPGWALLPMVLLATVATVIASQAVITGAFSVTQQAIQLGLLPRLEIQYTSDVEAGQIFLPDTNRLLLIGVLILVFSFRTSSALASAYGIAVTGTMVVTTCLAFIVVWKAWQLAPRSGAAVHCSLPARGRGLLRCQPDEGARRRLRAL